MTYHPKQGAVKFVGGSLGKRWRGLGFLKNPGYDGAESTSIWPRAGFYPKD